MWQNVAEISTSVLGVSMKAQNFVAFFSPQRNYLVVLSKAASVECGNTLFQLSCCDLESEQMCKTEIQPKRNPRKASMGLPAILVPSLAMVISDFEIQAPIAHSARHGGSVGVFNCMKNIIIWWR